MPPPPPRDSAGFCVCVGSGVAVVVAAAAARTISFFLIGVDTGKYVSLDGGEERNVRGEASTEEDLIQ